MLLMLLGVLVLIGEVVMEYNYVRTRYGWQVTEYSLYSGVCNGAALIGNFIPYFFINKNNLNIYRPGNFHSIDIIHGSIRNFSNGILIHKLNST